MIVVSVSGLIIVDHISELNHGICLVEQEICPIPKALVPPTLPSNSEKHGHENKTCLASPHNLNCLIDSLKYLFPQNTPIRQPP